MELNEEEIKEIESASGVIPAIAKLYEYYKSSQSDAGKQFYQSLVLCTRALQSELDNISSGKSVLKHRLLESDSVVWKRTFSLLVNSKKILAGLQEVKEVVNGKVKIDKISTQKTEVEEDDDETPLVDRIANNQKSK